MSDVKQKHQQKLIEKKIQEERKKEEEEYIALVMEENRYDWRKKINEGMTSSGTFFTTLPATGDLTISSNDFSDPDTDLFSSFVSGTDAVMVSTEDSTPISGANYTNLRQVRTANIDASKSTSITISIDKPTSQFSTWQDRDPSESFNDNIQVVAYSDSNSLETTFEISTNFNGTQTINLPSNLRVSDLKLQFSQFGLMPLPGVPDVGTQNATITVVTTQRKTPINVFVPLDSPEATSFIRSDPSMTNLSPEERLKKLKEMLESGDEYVMKMLGADFPGTGAVPPGEYDPFAQTPPGEAGDTPGVEISQLYPADYDMERNTDLMLLKGLQRGDYGTGPDIDKQIKNLQKNLQKGTPGGLPKAQANQDIQIAHYEPEGQLISEKKLKSPKEVLSSAFKKHVWKKINEQMTTADVFYTNLPAEGEVDLVSTDVSINFSGGTPGEIGSPSEGFYARTSIIGPVDTTRYDTLGITVTVNSSIDYGEGLILTSVGGLSGATVILSPGSASGTYYARLPSSSSASSYRLVQIVSSTGSSTFTINKISYQRRNPKNVFVSLDSPEATSFIRTDPAFAGLSEEEKKQKLKEMLEASDEYVMKMFGDEFPGTGAVPPGESGDTPGVETIDYGEDLTPLSKNPYGTEVGQIAGSMNTPAGAIKAMQDLMKDGFGGNQVRTTVNGQRMTGYPAEIINLIKTNFPGGV
jgi:hypothetical protein